jgi:hypothetical protein
MNEMSQIRALRESSVFYKSRIEEDSQSWYHNHSGRTLVTFNAEADINVTLQHLDLIVPK